MPVAELPQSGKEVRWRQDVAALPQDRFDQHGAELVDPGVRVAGQGLEVLEHRRRAGPVAQDGPIRVRVGDTDDLRPVEGARGPVLPTAGQVDRSAVHAMVGPREGDGTGTAGDVPGEAHRGLHGVAPRDGEQGPGPIAQRPGQDPAQLPEELQAGLGGDLQRVPEPLDLPLERRLNPRVTMAQVEDRDSRDPVDEAVAVDVLHRGPTALGEPDGEVPGVDDRLGLPAPLAFEHLQGARPRWDADEPRGVRVAQPPARIGHRSGQTVRAYQARGAHAPLSANGRWAVA